MCESKNEMKTNKNMWETNKKFIKNVTHRLYFVDKKNYYGFIVIKQSGQN